MLVYLSCAKLMAPSPFFRKMDLSEPIFQQQAEQHALKFSSLTVDDWSEQLHIKRDLAAEIWHLYQHFF